MPHTSSLMPALAHQSLFQCAQDTETNMTSKRARRCSYVVTVGDGATDEEVQELARYLSTLSAAECEVIILDAAAGIDFENHRRVLRWVGTHRADQDPDTLRAAYDAASLEKVIIATAGTRYTPAEIAQVCELLDRYEVVEPEEFIQPLPWWGGLDAARILLLRGVDHPGGDSATFGFRRSVFRPLRGIDEPQADSHVRRLLLQGTDFHCARDVFVRREAPQLRQWISSRAREARNDFLYPMKAAFFLGLLPLVILLSLVGGARFASGYAGVIAVGAVMLAVRGRAGAAKFFPLHSCLFAPLWIVERSIGVYWALFQRVTGTPPEPEKAAAAGTSRRARVSSPAG